MTSDHLTFHAEPATDGLAHALGMSQPWNPFATAQYLDARRRMGDTGWLCALRSGPVEQSAQAAACLAFVRAGRLNRTLDIPSLPAVDAASPFWPGLSALCRRLAVTQLELGSFNSPSALAIPPVGASFEPRARCEFVMPLTGDLAVALAPNHRRNIRKAERHGIVIERSHSALAAATHSALMRQSLERRRARGERTAMGDAMGDAMVEHLSLLASGAGELYQAVCDGTVLSSILVLRAGTASYYHSAGTSPAGMSVGASHGLVHHVTQLLQREGAERFNLGGADPTSTLARFKEGFGAAPVHLTAARSEVGPAWRRAVSRALVSARDTNTWLQARTSGRVTTLVMYAARPGNTMPPPVRAGVECRALDDAQLLALDVPDAAFHERQAERLRRFGRSYAYAVLVDGVVAHVSWLLPAVAIVRDTPRVLMPSDHEVEITCCETLPAFRGRGLYGFAIQHLMQIAAASGMTRVYMKTLDSNVASQVGIARAGLVCIGRAHLVTLPRVANPVVLRRYR